MKKDKQQTLKNIVSEFDFTSSYNHYSIKVKVRDSSEFYEHIITILILNRKNVLFDKWNDNVIMCRVN